MLSQCGLVLGKDVELEVYYGSASCRHSVGKSSAVPMRALEQGDFDPGKKFWTRFPPEGSKVTLPHSTAEFRWKDYCPMVFRFLSSILGLPLHLCVLRYSCTICSSCAVLINWGVVFFTAGI